jgi:hypothetical protein
VVGVGWGSDAEIDAATVRARAGDPEAAAALRDAALRTRRAAGR